MTDKVPIPVGLGTRGRRFWKQTSESFDLSPGERELLLEICRALDHLDHLAALVTSNGVMTTGAKGQSIINPAVVESRGQQAILHRLISALNLPDSDDSVVPSAQSTRAKRAAQARWRGHRKESDRRRPVGPVA